MVLNLLSRIMILGVFLLLSACGASDLPMVSQTPTAANAPLFKTATNPDTTSQLAKFAATGAECGVDEREVATMVYLPKDGELGEGVVGCTLLRSPARVRDEALHLELWNLSKALIPDADEARIKRVILAQDRRSPTLAFVATLDDDGEFWEYGLNLDAVNLNNTAVFEQLLSTIIHEYAHILSLNSSQVDYDLDQKRADEDPFMSIEDYEAVTIRAEERCLRAHGIYDGNACFRPGSYMYDFYLSFWDGYGEDVLNLAARGQVFDRNEDDFVNSYAGSSPSEDFAETFAAWLMPDVEDFDITSRVHEKFNFFAGRPSLMRVRNQIHEGLVRVRS